MCIYVLNSSSHLTSLSFISNFPLLPHSNHRLMMYRWLLSQTSHVHPSCHNFFLALIYSPIVYLIPLKHIFEALLFCFILKTKSMFEAFFLNQNPRAGDLITL